MFFGTRLPQSPFDVPVVPQTEQPFVWGQGGARLTPDQIAAQQAIAQDRMRADFSPVGSVWEGLGRVSDNVLGALDARRLDKQTAAANVDRGNQIAALLGAGNADLAPGIASSDPVVSALAGNLLQSRTPKAAQPTELQRNYDWLVASGKGQEANDLINKSTSRDNQISAVIPGLGFFNGTTSQLAELMKGGGQASGVSPGGAPPATLPADFDFGGPTQPASGGFPR